MKLSITIDKYMFQKSEKILIKRVISILKYFRNNVYFRFWLELMYRTPFILNL